MSSFALTPYLDRIPSQHNQRPKFMAFVALLAQWAVDRQNVLSTVPGAYDIDNAVGAQLDACGVWIGATRNLTAPLPPTDITVLGDADYRTLLKAIIAVNHWNGTVPGIYAIWSMVFGSSFEVLVQDNQDMTMFVVLLASDFDTVELALLTNNYITLVPAGVQFLGFWQPSTGTPVFGFNIESSNIAGLDTGAWVVPLTA